MTDQIAQPIVETLHHEYRCSCGRFKLLSDDCLAALDKLLLAGWIVKDAHPVCKDCQRIETGGDNS